MNKVCYIGIDPSINSTGICIKILNNEKIYKEYFGVIVPQGSITKKEQKIIIDGFDRIEYQKIDTGQSKKISTTQFELDKTKNLISIVNCIESFIKSHTKSIKEINIGMEGLSYGSMGKTVSLLELSGLNYLIRNMIFKNNWNLIICPPAEVKKFASGKGNAQKEILMNAFTILYPQYEQLKKIDDITDAYYICEKIYKL